MGIMVDLNGLGSIGNKCWGAIGFNVLLPIGPFVTVLFVCQVSYYSCHL